ncbi:hypothetical protein OTU49_007844, partial [Cherax quadricarinatus]
MNSNFSGPVKRDPKTFTGLSKRVGAVSHIAKSFENVERNSGRDSSQAAHRGRVRNEPQSSDSQEGATESQGVGQQDLQRQDSDTTSKRHLRRQVRPPQHPHT